MKILLLTTLYPESETGKRKNTPLFLHEYAAEWVSMGHEVLVFHTKTRFPGALVFGMRLFSKVFPKMGRARDFLNGYGYDKNAVFKRDGVRVVRRNLLKLLPGHLRLAEECMPVATYYRDFLKNARFVPDRVFCDFLEPNLMIARLLHLRGVTAILHDTCLGYLTRPATRNRARELLFYADHVAFRSKAAMEKISVRSGFLMPSGVPDSLMLPSVPVRTEVRRYFVASRLIARKRIDVLLRAFDRLGDENATLTVAGDGPEEEALRRLADSLSCRERIVFLGAIPREEVLSRLLEADCFPLVSSKETFGVAYVEAMSRGAIPIASVGEGADGVIEDGVNGLLAPAGDEDALLAAFLRLRTLDVPSLSKRAAETAKSLRMQYLATAALNAARPPIWPSRIVILARHYPSPQKPQDQIFIARLAREWAKNGVNVRVIVPLLPFERKRLGIRGRTYEDEGVRVYCPIRLSLGGRFYRITAFLFELSAMLSFDYHSFWPDALYAHFCVPTGTAAARIADITGLPFFVAYGESTEILLKKYGRERAYSWLRDAKGVIAVSQYAKERALRFSEAVSVFPNAVDSSRFYPRDRQAAREKFNLPQDAFVVAFVGSFDERKGALRLSEALSGTGAVGIFAGSGSLRPSGAFVGQVDPTEMPEFLSAADVFALPTRREGCCNAIVEAMACGLPIISSDRDFNRDICGADNAVLIDPDNVFALRCAVLKLKANPALRARLSKGSLLRAEKLSLPVRAFDILSFIRTKLEEDLS